MMCAASDGERKAKSMSENFNVSVNNSGGDSGGSNAAIAAHGKPCTVLRSHGGSTDTTKYKQNYELSEEDCDRSQSSISGASLDGSKRGRRSSFRSRAAKTYSPKIGWMNQGHHEQRRMGSDGYGSLTEENAVVSFSMMKRKASPSGREHMSEAHHDSASQASQNDTAHDDEGYLSHSTAEGYQSGGYHSYHHPALSYAPSVKSDIATVCSGSVVEDIDMAEMASVASGPTFGAATNRESTVPQHKGVEFASNILNDMGPPAQLCSALLLAANAACRPSSRCSLRSFDTNSVIAHVDTDDCCDRSIIESEACSLHSQDDTASVLKEGNFDDSARNAGTVKFIANGPLHNTCDPLSNTGASSSPGGTNYPLERFCQGVLTADNDCLLENGTTALGVNPWSRDYFDRTREDDWSNR